MEKYLTELSSNIREFLNNPGAEIKHLGEKSVNLRDIFVYPELLTSPSAKNGSITLSSKELLNPSELPAVILITGPENSGKTSLLKTLMTGYYEQELNPLYIDAKHTGTISENTIWELIRSSYERQYSEQSFERILTLGAEKRICLIDNTPGRVFEKEVMTRLVQEFGRILIFSENPLAGEVAGSLLNESSSLGVFELLELGPPLRKELCRKWHSLSSGSQNPPDIKSIDSNVESSLKVLEKALSYGLTPAYPIMVLTILNRASSDDEYSPQNSTYTSYIEHIILKPLRESSSEKGLQELIQNLSTTAYEMFTSKRSELTEPELHELLGQGAPERVSELLNSSALVRQGTGIGFKYEFAYSYFTANYIAQNLKDETVRQKIKILCRSFENEKSANIMLFLTHLSDDPIIDQEITKALQASHAGSSPESIDERLSELDNLIESILSAGEKDKKLKEIRAEYSTGKERFPAAFVTTPRAYEYSEPSDTEYLIRNTEDIRSDLELLRASGQALKKKLFQDPKAPGARKLTEAVFDFWLRSLAAALENLSRPKKKSPTEGKVYGSEKSGEDLRELSKYRMGLHILVLYLTRLSGVLGEETLSIFLELINDRLPEGSYELFELCLKLQKKEKDIDPEELTRYINSHGRGNLARAIIRQISVIT